MSWTRRWWSRSAIRSIKAGGVAGALALAGCGGLAPRPEAAPERAPLAAELAGWSVQPWTPVALPGKRPTQYRRVDHEGRPAVLAQSEGSASMFRRRLRVDPQALHTLDFSWWVPALMPTADLADRELADSPVRVVLAFDGDHRRLSARNRMLFELAETLSGEPPPYATLMYVWDNRAPLETVMPGGRTDRIRKIVVESGPQGLGRWRTHQRDIARDFERAFGESPGALIGVALMTDSDNTGTRATAWYGDLVFTDRGGQRQRLND